MRQHKKGSDVGQNFQAGNMENNTFSAIALSCEADHLFLHSSHRMHPSISSMVNFLARLDACIRRDQT